MRGKIPEEKEEEAKNFKVQGKKVQGSNSRDTPFIYLVSIYVSRVSIQTTCRT